MAWRRRCRSIAVFGFGMDMAYVHGSMNAQRHAQLVTSNGRAPLRFVRGIRGRCRLQPSHSDTPACLLFNDGPGAGTFALVFESALTCLCHRANGQHGLRFLCRLNARRRSANRHEAALAARVLVHKSSSGGTSGWASTSADAVATPAPCFLASAPFPLALTPATGFASLPPV
jgi:hypothetical protein